jgi:YidC/Oxa1 family membrane protein insertase
MEKRVLLAAILSVAILLLWQMLFMPPPPAPEPAELPPEGAPAPVIERDATPVPEEEPPAVEPAEPGPAEATEAVQAESTRDVVVDNGVFEVTLSNRGGVATSWLLRDDTTGYEPLELLPPVGREHARTLGVDVGDRALNLELSEALYRVEESTVSCGAGPGSCRRIGFEWSNGRDVTARKVLTFADRSYLVDVSVEVTVNGREVPASVLLGPGFGEKAHGGGNGKGTYYYEAVVWNRAGQVTHRKKGKIVDSPGGVAGRIPWAGLEDQYFAALVLPRDTAAEVRWNAVELLANNPGEEEAEARPYPVVAVSAADGEARLFVGPKKYRLLESLGSELEKAVWFSSSALLAWISKWIFFGLLWIHDHTIANYGLAIILATFLLRVLLFPVNQYSMVSMKKTQLQMGRLQPKIKAIKNKYRKQKDAETRAKMNQEMMALYKREGVNPMGGVTGCLPLLAQFPILIAFYFMLTVAVELRGAPFFGWITDLSAKDPLWITPLLMGVTMFVQQKMAMSKVKDPQQQQQQKIMMIMPFVFTWICLQMPAGMVLYWFVNNVLGIGQQWLVNRHTTRLEAAQQKA